MSYTPAMRERDQLDDVVDTVIEALEEMDDELLVKIGEALLLTAEPALRNDLADTFRFAGWGGAGGALIHIRVRSWLERRAGDEALLQRLEAAEQEPWPTLRAALVAASD